MFSKVFASLEIDLFLEKMNRTTESEVASRLTKSGWQFDDFIALISPAAQAYLEPMAQKSHQQTIQRFGRTIQSFMPLYISNECYNKCTYCSFSLEHKFKRVTLTDEQILREGKLLRDKGIQHLLILTGEAPQKVNSDHIGKAVELLKPLFPSIGIEVQPLKQFEYEKLISQGADSLTIYQETYHKETYERVHVSGKKRLFNHRLDTPDVGGKAGFYRLNIGSLLGLYDWRYEAICLAIHLQYLQSRYWQTKYSISFPRIRETIGDFSAPYAVSDKDIVQFIAAFRLLFPDIGITLSTREEAGFRDNLIPLGITAMSAESDTSPGGYSGGQEVEQFKISDVRTVSSLKATIESKGYEYVAKDWDRGF
ncbi:MAG: 2-iminoacetate synthase [Candidatus Marinamargulisbacteria bacterium]|jgi:2-iminoacetate synthase